MKNSNVSAVCDAAFEAHEACNKAQAELASLADGVMEDHAHGRNIDVDGLLARVKVRARIIARAMAALEDALGRMT